VAAAHVAGDLDLHLAVAEAADLGLAERHVDVAADRLRQWAVRAPREYLDLVLHRPVRVIPASWAGRSRTFAAGSEVRCLTSLATAHQSPSRVPAKRGMLRSVPFDVNLGLLPPERRGRKTRMLPFPRVAHAAAPRAAALPRARPRRRPAARPGLRPDARGDLQRAARRGRALERVADRRLGHARLRAGPPGHRLPLRPPPAHGLLSRVPRRGDAPHPGGAARG